MDDKFHPYAMVEFLFGDDDAALTVMSRTKRYHICIGTKDLHGPEGDALAQTFHDFKANMDKDPQAMEDLQEWMVKPCIPHMNRLASSKRRLEPPSLAEYFAPETIIMKLLNNNGQLNATILPDDPSATASLIPSLSISDPMASKAISQGVPCIPSSQLRAVLESNDFESDFDLVPGKVQYDITGITFQFKGAFDKSSFQREMDILLRFENDAFPADLHVSRIGGLVIRDDASVLGLLVKYIHGSRTLDEAVEGASEVERRKWARQLRDVLDELHRRGITWGDVKPDNALVDADDDIWVIDFGGGRAEGWVDTELEGTVEGDLQGLSSIEKFMRLGDDDFGEDEG